MILPERAVNWLAAAAVAALLAGGPSRAVELPDPARFGVAIEMGDLRAASASPGWTRGSHRTSWPTASAPGS